MADRPLREHLVRLLAIAGHVSKQTQAQRLAELGLSVREQVTLTAIAEGAPTQLAIGRRAGLDKSTLTPVLDQLERKELIGRHPDPDDRRARLVTVTDAGRLALAGSEQAVAEVEDDLLAALTPDEQRQFRALLRRVVEEGMSGRSVPGSCL